MILAISFMLTFRVDNTKNALHLVENEHFVSAAGNPNSTNKPVARLYTSRTTQANNTTIRNNNDKNISQLPP
jgi:hypothetical protein